MFKCMYVSMFSKDIQKCTDVLRKRLPLFLLTFQNTEKWSRHHLPVWLKLYFIDWNGHNLINDYAPAFTRRTTNLYIRIHHAFTENENHKIVQRTQYILKSQVIFLQRVKSRLCTLSSNFCNSLVHAADDTVSITVNRSSAIHLYVT